MCKPKQKQLDKASNILPLAKSDSQSCLFKGIHIVDASC